MGIIKKIKEVVASKGLSNSTKVNVRKDEVTKSDVAVEKHKKEQLLKRLVLQKQNFSNNPRSNFANMFNGRRLDNNRIPRRKFNVILGQWE